MVELTSAPPPAPGPADHVRGEGPLVTVFIDLACPACAALWPRLRELDLRTCVRAFPLAARRPRAPALHRAAEAAGLQGRFFELVDALMADPAHNDDPHLWRRARELGIDLERFESDRRSATVAKRVEADLRIGLRAGVSATPAAFDSSGTALADPLERSLALLGSGVPDGEGM